MKIMASTRTQMLIHLRQILLWSGYPREINIPRQALRSSTSKMKDHYIEIEHLLQVST